MSPSQPFQPPKLLDWLRYCIRDNLYSVQPEHAYVYWARWHIRFHGLRHPIDMGAEEICTFMSYLVSERQVAAATYTQALCALLFLYRTLLEKELPWIEGIKRPRKPAKHPVVLTETKSMHCWHG